MNDLTIGPGTRVTLHFSLALDDGTLVDSTFGREPAVFEVGDGSLLPGYEDALLGLRAGDETQFDMKPEHGFGQHNPNNIQTMARADFDPGLTLEAGLVLSFADANRAELPGVVVDFDEETVTVDFNHPLAGRDIVFRVAILAVEPAVTH
ncbi:MAG: FKBP-type peptidyl-prolyl cis-trans isomerase [Porticoccaceae bacterium]|jgi:FKBP-type peptidyl-prolyl cis-trans isomerase SlpA|nr:FKBP-type peptidyl-prolyl cis-trans isomerase [Porticoccaceae bacterium]MEA3299857.1 FKBP-type peptidyl-prolyl cis-trans isomerase [Pseudomonadota bacterium]HLS98405.1 FKBP-type peptidyl-prolyl cis-trans isomerase [Porticoccaceae bacterium]